MKSYSEKYMGKCYLYPPGGGLPTINGLESYYHSLSVVLQVTNGDHLRPNPHKFVVSRRNAVVGVAKRSKTNGSYRLEGVLIPSSDGGMDYQGNDMLNPSFSSVEATALGRLNDQVRGNLDLSVDLAEGHQAGVMLSDPFGLRTKARRFNKGVSKLLGFAQKFKGALREAGSVQLELAYGWRPLMSSIYGVLDEMIAPVLNCSGGHIRIEASATERESINKTSSYLNYYLRHQGAISKRCKYVIWLSPSDTALQSLARYTSLNPASLAWETLKLSFVIDWFIDVGGYLRNLETALIYNNRFIMGTKTTSSKSQKTVSIYGVNKYYYDYASGQGDVYCATKNRIVLTSYPMPRYPVLNVQLGASRLLSAAALLAQTLGVKRTYVPSVSRRRRSSPPGRV